MQLRAILLMLTALALLASVIGVQVHYISMKRAFEVETVEALDGSMDAIRGRLSSYLAEQLKPVRALAGLEAIRDAVNVGNAASLKAANGLLDHFQLSLGVDVCYLMNAEGVTIASSNRNSDDSFIGKNFAFRPYFQEAYRSIPVTYMALGTTSRKRGIYYSHPVLVDEGGYPVGVVVIKASVKPVEERLMRTGEVTALLVDPHDIVFAASQPQWLYKALRELTAQEEREIASSLQFGKGPWPWAGTRVASEGFMFDAQGLRHSVLQKHIENFPGWRIIVMSPSGYDYFSYIGRFFGQNRSLVFPLLGLICFSVILLYKRASIEFNQRRLAEAALRKNEERFRILYSRTPAMLHSIDSQSRLVRVSDYWIETMGYTRDEVVGRPITDFMTEDSKRYALEVVIPQFMEEGFCKDVAYCFKKKDGEVIDVLLSAIAELDEEGNLFRSLSIVVDVTEQNKVEKRLKTAQDQLRSYSRELERQVKERTLEITNIMKYTPALVSLKDLKGRYQLVNTRFEEIFGVDATSVRGKTDREVFPPTIADGLSANDEKVVETREPLSIEETIPRGGADRTYLSVKFPLFGPRGGVNGVGAISTDVTALKQAQEQLRSMSNRIVQGQERERAAISRELHDELGQVLTALKMDAAWLLKRVGPVDSNAGDRAKAMCEMIDATIDEVRSMVMRLRPGVLDDLGLTAALEWVAHEFEKRTGTTCTFRHSDIPEVGEEAATAVYRITQESLTNVTRHAKASLVEVSLAAEGEELVLRVSDDGRGLDSLGDAETGGHGLAGIRERASLIGATIEISSRQGRGVSLTFRLPVAWPPEEVAV